MLIDWLPNLLIAWSIHLMGVLSPGPAVAMLLGVGATRGRTAAIRTCIGIGMAGATMAFLGVVGLATVLTQAAGLMTAIKIVGAAYLLWLAWGSFRRMLTPPPPPSAAVPQGYGRDIAMGYGMQMSNPKAIGYWVAVISVSEIALAPLPVLVFFVVCAGIIGFLGHGAWGIALSSLTFRSLYARARAWIEGALGAFFTVAAITVATNRS